MNQTSHYQLNQWSGEDRILHTDFNADNAKIDAAIAGNAAAITAEAAARTAAVTAETEARAAAVTAEAQARAAGDLLVRLVDYTVSAAASQVNIDVSGIDFTQYSRIDFCLESSGNTGGIKLRVNNLTEYPNLPTSGSGSGLNVSSYDSIANWGLENGSACAILQFNAPVRDCYIHCLCMTAFGTSYSGTHRYVLCKWQDLKTFNLISSGSGTQIPAGTRVIVTGIRK